MTYLVDSQIKRLVEYNVLEIIPFDPSRIQPSSMDLTLDNTFVYRDEEIKAETFILPPLGFALGSTVEYIRLPDYITGELRGCSTIGRDGLFIQNAGHVDPGFFGNLTLELFNAGDKPIKLVPGQRICQMQFDVHKSCAKPYSGRYCGQTGATAPRGDKK
jgi:dCTP deaminase